VVQPPTVVPAVEEGFEQAHHADILNLQAGNAGRSLLHGLGAGLKEGELKMNIERPGLQSGEEDVMPVLDLLQGGVPFAPQAARQPCAEDLREVIEGATPSSQERAKRR
jgi:hypothetical protein